MACELIFEWPEGNVIEDVHYDIGKGVVRAEAVPHLPEGATVHTARDATSVFWLGDIRPRKIVVLGKDDELLLKLEGENGIREVIILTGTKVKLEDYTRAQMPELRWVTHFARIS